MRRDVHNSEVPVLCRACEARHQGVCGALDPVQLLRLSRHATIRTYCSGRELVTAGEQPARYANILSGVVKLTKLMEDGRQQIVALQFAPDFVGRPFRGASDVTAEAAGEVRVCAFPRATLEEMAAQSPAMAHRLHLQALRELDEAREWMLTLGRRSAREKVACFLLLVARHGAPEADETEGTRRFELPLTRAEIGDFLGLTIETVSRQITQLRQAGVIAVERSRTIVVPQMAALEKACGV